MNNLNSMQLLFQLLRAINHKEIEVYTQGATLHATVKASGEDVVLGIAKNYSEENENE